MSQGQTMMLCLQLGRARKWFCLTVSASVYRKSMLVPLLLDVINIRDSCPKSGQISQKICPEPDLGRFAKKGRMPDLLELEPKSGTSLLFMDQGHHVLPPSCWNPVVCTYSQMVACHYVQCAAKKVSPKVFCHFLRNCSEFLHEISHIYYSFIIT